MHIVKTRLHNNVSIQEQVGDYTISVTFDDSFGALSGKGRNDLRVFNDVTNQDVTFEVMGKNLAAATMEDLSEAYQKVKGLQTRYVAIGVNAWGIGLTEEAALKEMRKYCSKAHSKHFQLFEVADPNVSINEITGNIHARVEPKLVQNCIK